LKVGSLFAEFALYAWFKNRDQLLELFVGQSYLFSMAMDYLEVEDSEVIHEFLHIWVLMAQGFVIPIVAQFDEVEDTSFPYLLPKRLEFGTCSSRVGGVVIPLSCYLVSFLGREFWALAIYWGLFGDWGHSSLSVRRY